MEWLQFEPVSLDVNEACVEEEQDISNTVHVKNQGKVKALLNGVMWKKRRNAHKC